MKSHFFPHLVMKLASTYKLYMCVYIYIYIEWMLKTKECKWMRSWMKWYIHSEKLIINWKDLYNYIFLWYEFIYIGKHFNTLKMFDINTHRAWGNKVNTNFVLCISPCWRGKPFIESSMFHILVIYFELSKSWTSQPLKAEMKSPKKLSWILGTHVTHNGTPPPSSHIVNRYQYNVLLLHFISYIFTNKTPPQGRQ